MTDYKTGHELGLIDQVATLLNEFETRHSDDCVKRDLELIHTPCGTHICDVESGDTLEVLARTAGGHAASCPEDRWFVVVIREPDGKLHGLSRRQPSPDGRPFGGPWAALTGEEAARLADAYNADQRDGGTAEVVELFRYDRDPEWPEEFT